jgi:hypothetical protein
VNAIVQIGVAVNLQTFLVLLFAFVLCLPAPARAASFPGNEEIQAVAWASSPDASIRNVGAALAMPDVSMPANLDAYVAGRVGLTNFQGYTIEGGPMKFCTGALPGACALRPYGAVMRPGFYQRNIDVTKTLGNVPYFYNVFRPDSARPTFWVVNWSGGDSSIVVISSDSAANLSGFPNAFTAGASLGPLWGVVRVQGWGYTVGSTTYQSCYTGKAAQNTLTGALPRTTACASGGPGVTIWQHVFANQVAIPLVSK